MAVPSGALYNGTCGTCTWFVTSEKVLTIEPTSGSSGYIERNSSAPYFPWSGSISNSTTISESFTSVSVLTGVTVRNGNAKSLFLNCPNVYSISAPRSFWESIINAEYLFHKDSSLLHIDFKSARFQNTTNMHEMFSKCSSLTSLDVSSFETSNVTDMAFMFDECSSLTSLDVSRFETSNVTSMAYMFDECSSLTSLDVSGFDTSNVTKMNSMFFRCIALTNLDVSGFHTANVTNMTFMFTDCSSLTNLDVSGFDTSNVTEMDSMFSGCIALTNLDVSGFDTSSVNTMHSMFYDCSSLTSLDVSGFDTSSVTKMANMFAGCSSLTSLDVSGFDTYDVTLMFAMFSRCSSLTSLDVSSFDTSHVTMMNGMFKGCTMLSEVSFGINWMPIVEDNVYMAPCSNQRSGLICLTDDSFDNLTREERVGTWRRLITATFSVNAVRSQNGIIDEDGTDVTFTVTYSTDADTTDRYVSVYKKRPTEASYPSTAEFIYQLSADSGIEEIVASDIGDDAYDFRVEFYDGTNTFVAFPSVTSNVHLVDIDKDGNVTVYGDITSKGDLSSEGDLSVNGIAQIESDASIKGDVIGKVFRVPHPITGVEGISFGYGSGDNPSQGIWSKQHGKWLLNANTAGNVNLGGQPMYVQSRSISLPSTFAASNFWIRRYGAIVTVCLNNVSKAAVGENLLHTLPEGWRPAGTIAQLLASPHGGEVTSGSLSLRLQVNSEGKIVVYNYRSTAISSATNQSGYITYIATQ